MRGVLYFGVFMNNRYFAGLISGLACGVLWAAEPQIQIDGGLPRFEEAKFGKAADMNEYTCGAAMTLPGNIRSDRGTIEVWVRPKADLNPYHNYRTIFSVADITDKNERQSLISFVFVPKTENIKPHVKIMLRKDGKNYSAAVYGEDWKKDTTHYLAGTYGPEGLKLYIDGKLKAQNSYRGGFTSTGSHFAVGRLYNSNAEAFLLFDEVRISSEQRSAAEIAAAWRSSSAPACDGKTLVLCHFDGNFNAEGNAAARREAIGEGDFCLAGRTVDKNCNVFYKNEDPGFTAVFYPGKGRGNYRIDTVVTDFRGNTISRSSITPSAGSFRLPVSSKKQVGWFRAVMTLKKDGKILTVRKGQFVVLPGRPVSRFKLGIDSVLPNIPWETLKKSGFDLVRMHHPLKWHVVEKSPGVYDYSSADWMVKRAFETGMALMPILGGTPVWRGVAPDNASEFKGGRNENSMWYYRDRWRPRNLEEYRAYLEKTVARYKGKIKYYDPYNEPDWHLPHTAGFGFGGSTRQFADQLKVTAEAIRKSDPAAVVVFPGIACGHFSDENFVKDILSMRGIQDFDIVGMHSYGGNRFFQQQVERFRLAGYQGPVWVTERYFDGDCYNAQVKDAVEMIHHGCSMYVVHTDATLYRFGQPMPLAFTIPYLYYRIGGRAYSGKLPEVNVYRFGGWGNSLIIGWGEKQVLYIGESKVVITDLFGNSKIVETNNGAVTLTGEPVYIAPLPGKRFYWEKVTAQIQTPPAVLNSGFEDIDGDAGLNSLFCKNWSIGSHRAGQFNPDTAVKAAGKYSMRLTASAVGRQSVKQQLSRETAGKRYLLSADICIEKGKKVPAKVAVWCAGQNRELASVNAVSVGDGKFHRYTQLVEIPPDTFGNSLVLSTEKGEGKVWFDNVTLTPPELPIGKRWHVFLKTGKEFPVDHVPETVKDNAGNDIKPLKLPLKNNAIRLMYLTNWKGRDNALLYNRFHADKAGEMTIGVSADWWMELFVNGKLVFSTMKDGNAVHGYTPDDHVLKIPVKAGENLIVARVAAGNNGWRFVCGAPVKVK